jgi:hypothetical protein
MGIEVEDVGIRAARDGGEFSGPAAAIRIPRGDIVAEVRIPPFAAQPVGVSRPESWRARSGVASRSGNSTSHQARRWCMMMP